MTEFSNEAIQKVWEKAKDVNGYDRNEYRKDRCDAWIQYSKYGNIDSDTGYGWEIDHIIPESKGGSDDLSNLQPLQWKNNRDKGDGELPCNITSSGNKNVDTSVRT